MENNSTFTYHGRVTLTIKDGNKIIKQIELVNHGAEPLFRFFSYCLAAKYSDAEPLRPFKIKLFYNPQFDQGTEAEVAPEDYAPETVINDNVVVSSPFIYLNKPASVNQAGENWSTYLHFVIPYAYITGNKVNQICLYGLSTSDTDNEKYSAVYYIQKLNNKNKAVHDTIEVEQNKDTYSLIVEWQLAVSN